MKRPRPLADLLAPCLGPALAAQGFTGADILASWPAIVGDRLAAASRPIKVEWPRRQPGQDKAEAATLVVRVEGVFALELQHTAPLVVERVNAFYGWRCIGRLVLKQGPVGRREPARAAPPEPSPAQRLRVARAVSGLGEPPLRDALARLGEAVSAAETAGLATTGTPPPQSS